jgi:hypothetical protein
MRYSRAVGFVVLVGVLGILPVGCQHASVNEAVQKNLPVADAQPKALAVYEPWFGDPKHINVGYSTQDPATLKAQIEKARSMGIYGFVVDWYGDRAPFADRSYALMQKVASENKFHVAIMYDETEQDNGSATEDALSAFAKIYNAYLAPNAPGHDAYIYYNGRPLIVIFPKHGHTDWNAVREAVNSWPNPPLLIYKDEPPPQYVNAFDGYYPWVHPGSKGWTQDGADWGKQYLVHFYENYPKEHPGKLIIGTAWPGFNDSKASWSLDRRMDQRCGRTFEDTLHIFREHQQQIASPFLMIATWNDYEEGTAIEKGLARCDVNQAESASQGSSQGK